MNIIAKFDLAYKAAIADEANWKDGYTMNIWAIEESVYAILGKDFSQEEIWELNEMENMHSEYEGLKFSQIAAMVADVPEAV
jgi:hypothetical protein